MTALTLLIVGMVLAAVVILPLWAFIDLLRRDEADFRTSGQNRIAWVLVLLFFSAFGGVAYLLVGRPRLAAAAAGGRHVPQPFFPKPEPLPSVDSDRGVAGRLYHGETTVDFVGRFPRWLILSAILILLGLMSLYFRGLNLGIDFKGGVVWEVPAGQVSIAEAQDAMEGAGLQGLTVQSLTAKGERRLRVEAEPLGSTRDAEEISQQLADLTGSDVNDVSLNSVGPSWGEEISRKALRALIFFLIAITIYISLRFEFKMAVPTLVALIHDVLITIGVYSLAGFQVTPATVIALLTILGFSIYDGIVVFDKVDENTKLVGTTQNLSYGAMVNKSLNQVLMRSLNTSITALLPVASLLVLGSFVLGATTLEEFALALLIGLFAGAYSSIFIASPLLAVLKEREPRYRELKRKMDLRQGAVPGTVPAGSAVGDTTAEPGSVRRVTPGAPPSLSGRQIPPRPRKKGKRR